MPRPYSSGKNGICPAHGSVGQTSAAQSFVPSKKTAERDYLQQALEEVMQEEEQPPAQEGPSASGEPEGA